jgi:cytochrome c-type biogenesis protein CcmF
VLAKTGSVYKSQPWLLTRPDGMFNASDTILAEGLIFQLQNVKGNEAQLAVKKTDAIMKFVTLKAYKFPFINLVWIGTIIMIIGFLISMLWRIQTNKVKEKPKKLSFSKQHMV